MIKKQSKRYTVTDKNEQFFDQDTSNSSQILRRKAEVIASLAPKNLATLSEKEADQLIHELQVHQIELEMQNEQFQRVQTELEDARKRYFDLYELAPVGYCTLNEFGVIVQTNLTAALMLGHHQATLLQNKLSAFIIYEDQDIYYLYIKQLLQSGSNPICELRMFKANQTLFWANLTTTIVRDSNNSPQWQVVVNDISERKKYEIQLQHIAQYDPLTSLPNRILLADRLEQAMAHSNRSKQLFALLYLDIDGFKYVNDTFGHEVGDQLLVALATNMKRTLREIDTIARIGGDEFVILLLKTNDIQACVGMLNRLLHCAKKPVMIEDQLLYVSASIGVTFFPQSDYISADQLLSQADYAMYQAKAAGKNRYHVFDLDKNEGF